MAPLGKERKTRGLYMDDYLLMMMILVLFYYEKIKGENDKRID